MYQVKLHVQKHAFFFLLLATFKSEYEYDYEYEFSVLSTRCRFKGRNFSKCACSELKTRTRSRPRTPIWRSLLTRDSKTYGSDGWLPSVSGSWMRNISPQKDDWLTKHGWSTEQKQSLVYKQSFKTSLVTSIKITDRAVFRWLSKNQ